MASPALLPAGRTQALHAAALLAALFATSAALAEDVPVDDAASLAAAISSAQPGDRILLAPGTYDMPDNVTASTPGTAGAPIIVRAQVAGSATVRFGGSGGVVEGFRVGVPHWRFEGLVVEGDCAVDSDCEHAFHLFGDAEFFVLRDSELRDFNAQIKSNGIDADSFPDDVLVERNRLYDTRPRATENPVTKIDVVGGRRWVVRDNVIHDFEKAQGNGISYGAFLKGNSSDGVFERNLVMCARQFDGGVRIGLSLGGGGTGAAFCEGGSCDTEHRRGTLRNNLILRCSDVGIYLNQAADTLLLHNTLYDTDGIDVRFPASTADVRNNLVGGSIDNRDGGTHTAAGNLAGLANATFEAWFADPALADFTLLDGSMLVDAGVATPEVDDDYCGAPRSDGAPDVGAIEYATSAPCDTTQPGSGAPVVVFADGFEGVAPR